MKITIEINDEKANAINLYMKKHNPNENLSSLIQKSAEETSEKAYNKYVPKAIRDYFNMLNGNTEEQI